MSDLRKYKRAFIEAGAPLLRKALQGEEITEDELKDRLEYQLQNRDVDIEGKTNNGTTEEDTDE